MSHLYKPEPKAFRKFVLQSFGMKTTIENKQTEQNHTIYDVIISGAGPVGLFLATELALAKCSVLILEKTAHPQSTLKRLPFGIRGLTAPSIEALYRRGLYSKLELHKRLKSPHSNAAQGPRRQAGHFAGIPFHDGDIDYTQWKYRLPGATETSLISEIEELETLLTSRAEAGNVIIKRGFPITSFEQTGDGVRVQSNGQSFEGKWLLGCDGSRSIVRKLAGFEFAGTEPEFTGYSVHVDLKDPEQLKPGRNMTSKGMYLQSQPGYLMLQDFDGGAFHQSEKPITSAHVQEVLRRISNTDVTINTLHIASTWTDRARQASTYRKGRVLLAGDAAHIHSPLGGQGLNLGLGDAMNLGWKLAATLQNKAPEGLLDSYQTERHPIGAAVLDWSRAQVAIMKPDPASRALQAIVRDLMDTPDGATYFAGRVWGVSSRYNLGGKHPMTGHSVPNFELEDGRKIAEFMQDGKGILLDFSSSPLLKAIAAEYDEQLKYISSQAKEQLGLSTILIRPDGFIAWLADKDPDDQELKQALDRWFLPNSNPTSMLNPT